MFSAAVLASVLSVVSAYSKCSPSDVRGPISIPIMRVLVTSDIQVSGNIEIVDGCTFKITGFSLRNASPSKWYGGNGTSVVGVTLADDLVSSASGEQTFKFRDVVGAEVSFRDFDQFRLLEESTQTLIATAQVPSSVRANLGQTTGTGQTGNTTGSTTVGTAGAARNTVGTAGATASPKATQPASDNSAQVIGHEILGLLMMAFAL